MNIGFFTDTYFPQVNGVTFTVDLWRKRLEERGHKVYVYYPDDPGYQPKEREYAFPSISAGFYKGYRGALPLNIASKTKHLDIIHQHGMAGLAIAGLIAARKHHIPKMHTFHTPGDEYINYVTKNKILAGMLRSGYLRWERWLLNTYGLTTTASPVIAEKLRGNGIRRVELISNGIDTSFFHRVDAKPFLKKYGIPEGKVIGFCGRLGYEKHVEELINLADRFDGTIIYAGKGPAEDHYRKLAEGKPNVKVFGFLERTELRQLYSALDVFVFPSVAETQGLVALEAMAAGVPVVGVPVLALKTTIDNEVTGYHYSLGHKDELLQKIELCYRNKDKLAPACIRQAEANSVERSIDRLEQLYQTLK